LLAAGFYLVMIKQCQVLHLRVSWIFATSAAVMLPIALFYRPSVELRGEDA
jgi:hypothetical protein